jgi:putative CocE/NonD family hydrolase
LVTRRLSCALSLVLALTAGWLAAGPSTAAPTPVQKQGYIPMADGTKLAYAVELPAAKGRFPVALAYAGYCEGSDPYCNDATNATALVAAGYAVQGVNIRGTGCSTGVFDPFTAQEWRDGAAAVEWAARQPWSTGHVGLFGDSFPGITQLGVAGLRPAHLDAIAPFQVTTDIYRDVGYPGGIANTGFGAFWGAGDQPAASFEGAVLRTAQHRDVTCAGAQPTNVASEPTNNIAHNGLLHPYDDAYWRARRPGATVDRIDVPVFGCLTWQDDEVSSRSSSYLNRLDPSRTWVVAANGYHAQCEITAPRITEELVAFFDRFVKGEANGFERTPHVQLWHDAVTDSAGHDVPTWVTRYRSYAAVHPRPLRLYLGPGGTLALHQPQTGLSASYAYPGPALGNEEGVVFGQHNLLWNAPEPPGASVAFTSPRLRRAAEFFGSGSADVWVSSTATDTDFQITLTEVRPDGQEVYVARGWLRASHRMVDRKRSTALAPYHPHQESDARPIEAGRPTLMRIQLFPFDYAFHKGSSIRLWIDAPTGETGGWSFDFIKTPAVNTVYADARHPSAIVLGYIRDKRPDAPLSTCNSVLNQPCRQNNTAVPPGSMAIRPPA